MHLPCNVSDNFIPKAGDSNCHDRPLGWGGSHTRAIALLVTRRFSPHRSSVPRFSPVGGKFKIERRDQNEYKLLIVNLSS
jgi:hypothetical protein